MENMMETDAVVNLIRDLGECVMATDLTDPSHRGYLPMAGLQVVMRACQAQHPNMTPGQLMVYVLEELDEKQWPELLAGVVLAVCLNGYRIRIEKLGDGEVS